MYACVCVCGQSRRLGSNTDNDQVMVVAISAEFRCILVAISAKCRCIRNAKVVLGGLPKNERQTMKLSTRAHDL